MTVYSQWFRVTVFKGWCGRLTDSQQNMSMVLCLGHCLADHREDVSVAVLHLALSITGAAAHRRLLSS